MHYKPIQEGHIYNLIFEKDLDLVVSGSFYCDYTHVINQNATFWNTNIQNNKRGKNKNKVTCIVFCFDWCVQFFKLEAYSIASLHP
jgi:hypothetical protein